MSSDRLRIDDVLAEVRERIPRLTPGEALAAQRRGAIIVDTRDGLDRLAEGAVPGAVVVTRNTLEWRADPTAEVPHPLLADAANDLVVMCNDGYSSGLAVDSLHRLGRTNVSDLVGGYRAWRAEGLPTVELGLTGGDERTDTAALLADLVNRHRDPSDAHVRPDRAGERRLG